MERTFQEPAQSLPRNHWYTNGKIIKIQLDVKNLTQYWKKMKAPGLNGMPSKIWKTKKYDDIPFLCNTVHKENTMDKRLAFPKKRNRSIPKKHRGITLTAMADKIYNALLLNRI